MDNRQIIWQLLMKEIRNPYGVAGLMGNLQAESGLSPASMGGKNAETWKGRHQDYILQINEGLYTREQFIKDGIAFGLVQWLYYSRKGALYDFAKESDIGCESVQTEYLLKEIQGYSAVWKILTEAKSIKEASDIVLEKYERPATINDAVKEKRSGYGRKIYDEFAGMDIPEKKVKTIVPNVCLRDGNGLGCRIIRICKEKGETFSYFGEADGWYAVTEPDGKIKWISKKWTEEIL